MKHLFLKALGVAFLAFVAAFFISGFVLEILMAEESQRAAEAGSNMAVGLAQFLYALGIAALISFLAVLIYIRRIMHLNNLNKKQFTIHYSWMAVLVLIISGVTVVPLFLSFIVAAALGRWVVTMTTTV